MKTTSQNLLNQLRKEVENHIEFIEKEFSPLSNDELNIRPAEGKWSIAECMAHLNKYARHYNAVMEQKMKQSKRQPVEQFKSGWLGEKFTKMMAPQEGKIVNPMNTIKGYDPINSELNAKGELQEQLDHLKKLITLLDFAHQNHLIKIRIPITITNWIKMSLGDTFRFNIAHIHRHLLQAKNVKSTFSNTTHPLHKAS